MAENFRRNMFSTTLVLATVIAIAIFALPTASAGGVTSTPGGTTIENVVSGQTFLLRHELYFDQPAGGYFAMAINWDVPSSDENFTLDNAPSIYWISGPENGLPVENVQWENNSNLLGGWTIGIFIGSADKNYVNGHFNVDIWLRARSGDGTFHRQDNQQLNYGPGIAVTEPLPSVTPVDIVTVNVIVPPHGVDVLISPDNQGNFPGRALSYTVKVTNVGGGLDSFTLENIDNDNWILSLSDNLVGPLENLGSENVILTVTIPENAVYGAVDSITVIATSQGDNTKSDNDSCLGHAASPGVDVLISPDNQGNFPGRALSYTVKVTNTGGGVDNFTLENIDNASWALSLSPNVVGPLSPGASDNVTLTVTILGSATYGTVDNIIVTATSKENDNISDNYSCLGYAASPGVDVLISPDNQGNFLGRALSYTVKVTNTGGGVDNFTLENIDNASWALSLSSNVVGPLENGAYENVILTVTIPENAIYGTIDNITVIATSKTDNTVSDNASCLGYAASPSFNVSISPSSQENFPGGKLSYTIGISNTGKFDDNYKLTFRDNIDGDTYWEENLSLDNNLLAVQTGEIVMTMLSVTIPDNAPLGTDDNITVTATSQSDNTIGNSASCIAHVSYRVGLSISPHTENGYRGNILTYNVTIKNIGIIKDNFSLTIVGDNAGLYPSWNPTLDNENFYNVLPGESRSTNLRVTVSWYSPPGTNNNITLHVASMENGDIYAENYCIAYSTLPLEKEIYPIDDVYVDGNFQDQNSNFGGSDNLRVGRQSAENSKRAFLKFDLGLPGGSIIDNVWLYIRANNKNGSPVVQCYIVENNDWSENMITWNNRPAISEVLDNQTIIGSGLFQWKVTDFVENQFENENDQIVSFCMIVSGESTTNYANFNSKESTNKPYLKVIYHGVNKNSEVVTVSPSYAIRMRSISCLVTVQNVGWENSSYTLENVGTISWPLTLDNYRFDNIPPGENRTTTLRVTIPYGTDPLTRNEITVKATCVENTDTIGFDKCVAYSVLPLISVSPPASSGSRGATLTYGVGITNLGTSPENFIFTVRDNDSPSWNPTLDNYRFDNVPIGGSMTTTLGVPVAYDSPPGTSDNITVRAALASDNNFWVENSCIANSTLVDSMNINPIDDSYVLDNTPDQNYGTVENLLVGWSNGTAWPLSNARSFLKFHLAIPGGSTIDNAWLYLWALYGARAGVPVVQCYSVNNDNWNERTINWNSQPVIVAGLDNNQVTNTPNWYIWRVTDFIRQQYENQNDRFASLCMIGDNENWVGFSSKEGTFSPYLLISYHVSSRSDIVTISPSDNRVVDNLSYPVTVQNVGWENSSYQLSVTDTLDWTLALDNYEFDNIQPGEIRNTRLWVTLSRDAPTHTRDEITVKATCIDNENTVGSAACLAEIARSVTISIPPTELAAKWLDNVTFTVTVTNTGNITDNYALTDNDDAGWELTLLPTSLMLVGGASDNATLTVMIPGNAAIGTRDNIHVRATSQTDNAISDEALCTARTASGFRRVSASITPSQSENLPGENVTFTITVTNKGNVRDNYLLTVDDNAGWAPTLSAPWVLIENAANPVVGTSENVVIRVRIPDNAVSSAMDNISVTVRSKYDNTVSARSSCIALAVSNRGVKLTISPNEKTGAPGESLKFTVTIQNTGEFEDNYDVIVSDDAGWDATLSANTATISAGENHTVIASVTVPSDAVEGESTVITVTASGTGYENSATCTAIAGAKKEGNLLVIIIIAVVAVAIGVGAAIAVLLKKGIINLHSSAR